MVATVSKSSRRQQPHNPAPPQTPATPVELIDVGRIDPHPHNPRQDFNDAELATLAGSCKSLEMLTPLQVEPSDQPERFRILAGERRWRAAKLAGMIVVPCIIRRLPPEKAALVIVEDNMLRKDLNVVEQARAVELLCKPADAGGAGIDQKDVAQRFGKDPSWVSNMLRILRLPPEWLAQCADGRLCFAKARALVPYVKRKDVLAAVAADMKANPEEWQLVAHFETNLAATVARFDNLARASAGAAESGGGGHDQAEIGHRAPAEDFSGNVSAVSPDVLPLRRALPIPSKGKDEQTLLATACVQGIVQIHSLPHLEEIRAALEQRIEWVKGQQSAAEQKPKRKSAKEA